MIFEQLKNELFLSLKLEEAIELRDSLNDLIEKNNSAHHHICSYDMENGTIDAELTIALETTK